MASRFIEDAKQHVEDCLREGYFPPEMNSKGRAAHTEAATRLAEKYGVSKDTTWKWIVRANQDEATKPDYSLFRPFQYAAISVDGTGAYRPPAPLKPEGHGKRVGLIGDAHDAPSLPDKSRFEWMGKWVRDNNFDEVIQIGDLCTLDSLTRHAPPGTLGFASLPSFKEDLDSLNAALRAFDKGLGDWKGKKVITEGNHEARAYKYEDNNPQLRGIIVRAIHDVFLQWGWRLIPYQEIYFLEGVGITHHVTNTMGKAYGGKTAGSRAANDTTFSLIHGHTHVRSLAASAKIGPMGGVDVVSIGCSLPWGHVEDYAKHGPSGWWWGVTEATLIGGNIADIGFKSMLDLERDYG